MFMQRYRRPAFISRLGWLILAQIIFLFASLVIVLFGPSTRQHQAWHPDTARSFLFSVEQCLQGGEIRNGVPDTLAVLSVRRLLEASRVFHTVRLFVWKDGALSMIFDCAEADAGYAHGSRPSDDDSGRFADLLEFVSRQSDGYTVTLADQNFTAWHYCRVSLASAEPAVLAVEEAGDVIVSSRSDLKWALLVLFLISALVSLLIVYLLWTRFKEPLDRLTRGIETTAMGEPYVTNGPDDETEVSRLADGFNRISEVLRHDHVDLQTANRQLQQANEALAESEQFLTAIIDSSPSPVIVTDVNNRVVLFNRASAKEFQRSSDEAIGRDVSELFSLPSNRASVTSEISGFETVCWRRDGDAFPAYILSNAIGRADGTAWVRLYVLRDIAESRGFQDMMVRLDRMATRGEMAGDIGHEINNFLAVLLGNIELLPRVIAKNDEPAIAKKLDVMKVNVEKIARFADGLMDGGQEESVFAPSSMNQLVENVVAFVKHQNRFDGIDWIIQLQTGLAEAEMDAGQIQQVLVNLLYNAAEAVGNIEGNHMLSITTREAERQGSRVVRVEVRDNGAGVFPDKEPLLFRTRFTTKKKGHGIGLITCRKILDGHGGWIGYRKDSGADFWFEVPLVHVPHIDQSELQAESTAVTA
jgi:PAS domain S-box-containing protein